VQKCKDQLDNLHDQLDGAIEDKEIIEANIRLERDAHNAEVTKLTATVDKLRTDIAIAIPSDDMLDSISIGDLSAMLEANTNLGIKIKNAIVKKTAAIMSNGANAAEMATRATCPVCLNPHAKPNIVANCCGKLLCTGCLSNWGIHKHCCFCRAEDPAYTRLADTVFD
jgi:DNA repair exonuclease SbcCD ATPase subunit